jgi:pimeloyl-ACP methyl ester carboxylesterase
MPGAATSREDGRTTGVSAMVYRTVHGVTQVVGAGIDSALAVLAPYLGSMADRPEREHIQSAVNGLLGDHLASSGNPLAITMQVRKNGATLDLNREALSSALPEAGGRILMLVHGLCMNDRQWSRRRSDGSTHDHGLALQAAHGHTAVYLHYNTGLNIADNGRMLSDMLEELVEAWPAEVEELVILAHSMGGLVARSAHRHAEIAGHAWPGHASKFVFLGTPHHGAPLERGGHWFDLILGATPFAAPFAKIGKTRSAGITDLRHGGISADGIGLPPLPEGVECFAVAGTTGPQGHMLRNKMLGDGLVPVESALGLHDDPRHALCFPAENRIIAHAVNHMQLLGDEAVYATLEKILQPVADGSAATSDS